MTREQNLPDRSICRAGTTSIDRAQHLARALAALWRHSRVVRDALALDRAPEPGQSGLSIRCEVIEHDHRRERVLVLRVGERDVILLAANIEPQMSRVMLEYGAEAQFVGSDGEAVRTRTCGEQYCCRIDLRGPEDLLGLSWDKRVGAEIATPIGSQILPPFRVKAGRWTQDPDRLSGSRGFGAGIPRQGHPELVCRYSHKRSPIANFHLPTSSNASAQL
jgi:hypothetical protein